MTGSDTCETAELLAAAGRGDIQAVNQLFSSHREYLKRIINVRLDQQLRGRIDPSDVVQETLVVANRRIRDYLDRRPTTFRLWLRLTALEMLIDHRRYHRRLKRDVARDIPIDNPSSIAIAAALMGDSASHHRIRDELVIEVNSAMESLSDTDREVLVLRHGEELSNAEVADVLEIEPKAASARYGRALLHLSSQLKRQGVLSGPK